MMSQISARRGEWSTEERLINHVSNVRFEDLPGEVVRYCKLLMIDSLGVVFPGSRAPGCPELINLVKSWGGQESGSTILIHGHKTSPPFAALANSVMMHALDFDDTLDSSALHTFVNVLPAALATAEHAKLVDGKRFITALVLGVDVICRIATAIRRPLSWIRTATCGSFGAAATAAKILELEGNGLLNALGIVYSQSAGNAQGLIEGRLVKRMQPGFASQAGVISAFLAKTGITGSHHFLEGRYGFYNLYEQGEYDPHPIYDKLGEHYTILDVSVKPYPCCRMTHASIDAALELRKTIQNIPDDITGIEVAVSEMVAEMVGKPFKLGSDPQVDAQFSIPYTTSVALLRGDVFLEDFEVSSICQESVQQLAKKVHVVVDPHVPAKDILHARMTVKTRDGEVHETKIDAPLGNPRNLLGIDGCEKKFRRCLLASGLEIDESKTDELLSLIEDLEQIQDIKHLISLMQI